MTVLLVDDDPDIRTVLPMVLESYGFPTTTAASGEEALQRLRSEERPCLVLLDLMMPGMDGYEFREVQLADPALRSIPVVVLSGADSPGEVLDSPTIQKPVELDELLAVVRRFCPPADDPGPR